MRRQVVLLTAFAAAFASNAIAQRCGTAPLQIQILNSGTLELVDGRAPAAMLVWRQGKPRILIDAGPGTAQRIAESGVGIADLDMLLFTQLRLERTGDLPALLQLATSVPRQQPLPIYGPAGNRYMPSTVSFVRSLFDPTRGSWRHLGDMLSPLTRVSYKLDPHDLRSHPTTLGVAREDRDEAVSVIATDDLRISALPVLSGQTPTLAWRIDSHSKRLVVASHAGGETFERFARGADMLVVPQMVMEDADKLESVHPMTPTTLGRLARATGVKQLVLAPRAGVTRGQENDSSTLIHQHYNGSVTLANDLDCITP